jgi:hypothetical protein
MQPKSHGSSLGLEEAQKLGSVFIQLGHELGFKVYRCDSVKLILNLEDKQ